MLRRRVERIGQEIARKIKYLLIDYRFVIYFYKYTMIF